MKNQMTSMQYAQIDNLLLDEANINRIERNFATTEKGDLSLVLDRGSHEYYFTLNGDKLSDYSNKQLIDTGLHIKILSNTL